MPRSSARIERSAVSAAGRSILRQFFAGQFCQRLYSRPFLLYKGFETHFCTFAQYLGLFHGQRVAAAQHFFPTGGQAAKIVIALVVFCLPDIHLTLQLCLDLFQLLNMLLQAGRCQLRFYVDVLCVERLALPLFFLKGKAILFQPLHFSGQILLFGLGFPGGQVVVGTVGNVLVGLDLVA